MSDIEVKVGQVWCHPKYGTWRVRNTTAKMVTMARCDMRGNTSYYARAFGFRKSTILRDYTLLSELAKGE